MVSSYTHVLLSDLRFVAALHMCPANPGCVYQRFGCVWALLCSPLQGPDQGEHMKDSVQRGVNRKNIPTTCFKWVLNLAVVRQSQTINISVQPLIQLKRVNLSPMFFHRVDLSQVLDLHSFDSMTAAE